MLSSSDLYTHVVDSITAGYIGIMIILIMSAVRTVQVHEILVLIRIIIIIIIRSVPIIMHLHIYLVIMCADASVTGSAISESRAQSDLENVRLTNLADAERKTKLT